MLIDTSLILRTTPDRQPEKHQRLQLLRAVTTGPIGPNGTPLAGDFEEHDFFDALSRGLIDYNPETGRLTISEPIGVDVCASLEAMFSTTPDDSDFNLGAS